MSTGFVPSSVSTVCVTRQPWGSSEVEAFLSRLANERKVSVSTHRQALAALLFFYGKVLCTDLPRLQEIGRPRPSRRLPVVLTPDEGSVRILGFLEGEHRLFAQLLYGTGMRISEGLQLRVRIWISITARSSCGRARAPGSGLDVTRELGTQPARAAVACTGMVAEGPGRGPQRRCASRRP
ncbi:phage integrase N-terminal SAM-like domain-containing protein [Enterobacter hormaechei]|uniref:phage integrase N-terminal SAM-like domain-containing protein n=1 Tax=Enterobacter hormaechei TaxID=158836 RepID=UPI0038901BA3